MAKTTKEQAEALQRNVKAGATRADILIGIDPGVHTGVAIWSKFGGLLFIGSMKAIEAEQLILQYKDINVHVFVEDTRKLRLPKALQNAGRAKGAGSVHRDMTRFFDFLEYHKIPFTMTGLSPKEYREGKDEWFRAKTGWGKRTNSHGRAAAGLILSRVS